MTEYDTYDYHERGRIEAEIMLEHERLRDADAAGDLLAAHNARHRLYEAERQLEMETRQPNRLTH